MKAIVNVNKASSYSKFNGLTFEVAEILERQIGLLIPNKELGKDITTDFSYGEVFIVDIEKEIETITKKCHTDPTANNKDFKLRFNLLIYKNKNKLQF